MRLLSTLVSAGVAGGAVMLTGAVSHNFLPSRVSAEVPPSIGPLVGAEPLDVDLSGIVVDRRAARQLGKALFWDTKVGSDGQACASCHFHAGVDIRTRNQLNPGHDGEFGRAADGRRAGPNVLLVARDFPFHRLADPLDRNSRVTFDSNERTSSQGAFGGLFVSPPVQPPDPFRPALPPECEAKFDTASPFHAAGRLHRKVEPRQTPTAINAVFNVRQFWDGRANETFNGIDPFGRRTNLARKDAGVLLRKGTSRVVLQQLEVRNASLASQAVGPPLSSFEMACQGLTFADLGRKLLSTQALSEQAVDRSDSLLGALARSRGKGIESTYEQLVRRAFHPNYWSARGRFTVRSDGTVAEDARGYTQIEHNFSLFFGISVMEYERTLISDRTPFDKGTISAAAERGKSIFTGKGLCVNCHGGPLLTNAARTSLDPRNADPVERMRMGDGRVALYDDGFYNIGVRPTGEDRGVGGEDPYGNPLSFTRQYRDELLGKDVPDRFDVRPCSFEVPFSADGTVTGSCNEVPTDPAVIRRQRDAVDGAFKVPGLRNVGLTAPYMHNGGFATLGQVIEFYDRGGDRRGNDRDDTTGFGKNGSNLDPDIRRLELTPGERADLEAFLLSLTDRRVACHQGPFDHPEIDLLEGHAAGTGPDRHARDIVRRLPAVGRAGLPGIGKPCFPNTGDLFGETQAIFSRVAPRR